MFVCFVFQPHSPKLMLIPLPSVVSYNFKTWQNLRVAEKNKRALEERKGFFAQLLKVFYVSVFYLNTI